MNFSGIIVDLFIYLFIQPFNFKSKNLNLFYFSSFNSKRTRHSSVPMTSKSGLSHQQTRFTRTIPGKLMSVSLRIASVCKNLMLVRRNLDINLQKNSDSQKKLDLISRKSMSIQQILMSVSRKLVKFRRKLISGSSTKGRITKGRMTKGRTIIRQKDKRQNDQKVKQTKGRIFPIKFFFKYQKKI